MNTCYQGGYVVSSKYELPKDPVDYQVNGLPKLGCTRIRCQQCRMLARSIPDTWFKDENAAIDLRDLYEMPDPTLSPLLVPMKGSVRMYLCRCKRWLEHSDRSLQDPDPDLTSPNLPWACDGHPAAELPRELDGVHIANERQLLDVVLASLRGTLPAGANPAYAPRAFYAARMYARFAGTPLGEAIAGAVSAAIEDPSPEVRARALQFFFTLELPQGARRAAELLAGDRTLFAVRDTATPVSADRTLEDTLWRIATPLVAGSTKLRDLARADALAPGKGRESVYTALARGDAPWVAEHAEQIYRATPALVRDFIDIVRACFPPDVAAKPVVERLRNLIPKA